MPWHFSHQIQVLSSIITTQILHSIAAEVAVDADGFNALATILTTLPHIEIDYCLRWALWQALIPHGQAVNTPEATVVALAAIDVAIPAILASTGLPDREREAIVAALEEPVHGYVMGVLQL